MATITEKPIPVIGCNGLVLFPVLTDTKTELTTDDTNLIDLSDCMVSKVYTPQIVEGKFYASNKTAVAIKMNKGGTLALVIPSLSEEMTQSILGAKKNAEDITVQGANDTSPEFIVAYRIQKTNTVEVLEKIGKVVFSTPTDTVNTQGENITFQTSEITGEIVPLVYGGNGDFKYTCDSDNLKYETLKPLWATKGTAGIVPAVGV